MKTNYPDTIDVLNYYAIDYLERLGNFEPTQDQISVMEKMLELCGLAYENNTTSTFTLNLK